MTKERKTILLVEDDSVDAQNLERVMSEIEIDKCAIIRADGLAAARQHLSTESIDAVVLDLSPPGVDPVNSVIQLLSEAPNLPLIVLAEEQDDNLERELLRRGVSEFLVKGEFDARHLGRALRRAIQRTSEQQMLQAILARDHFLLSASPAVIYTAEPHSPFRATFISDNIVDLLGYTQLEFTQTPSFWADHIHPADRARVFAHLGELN